jgi:hypothetical protein
MHAKDAEALLGQASPLLADSVAKVVLQKVLEIRRAAGAFFV